MASSPPNTNFTTTFLLLLLFLPSLSSTQPTTIIDTDTAALTQFLSQITATQTTTFLHTNWTTTTTTTKTNPCFASWHGVKCTNGRVTSLSLPSLSLHGPITSLSHLSELRHLNLANNRLYGSLLPLTNCSNLKLLYLSSNNFSQQIPTEMGSLHRLVRLDLSNNKLHASIPKHITNLTRLITLRLQNNVLSGEVPDLSATMIKLREFNVAYNQLSGYLPEAMLKKFGMKSFDANSGLCGFKPLPICSASDIPVVDPSPATPMIETRENESQKGLNHDIVIIIIVSVTIGVVVAIIVCVFAYLCEKNKREVSYYYGKKKFDGARRREGEGEQSKLVFYDRRKVFELEELLKASADMLGKGSLGTVYKAMLDEGCIVAVKRLRDEKPCTKKEFERYMDVVGKLRHPNIVGFRAYYCAKGEKLLVYDYLPNGSLHSLLHGNRGPGRIPLDWTTRISLVLGAARGLARIHEEYSATKVPHGNVKSSNVLVDRNGVACIADFGLALLLSPVQVTAKLGGYRAPEQAETKKLSQQADVYSFGVLVLEVLTGKSPLQCASPSNEEEQQVTDLPKWVRSVVKDEWTAEVFDDELLRYKNIEEELMTMLRVGLACVVEQPDKRPTMREVVKMIEDIRVAQTPLGEDLDESRTSLSPSNATTEDARASC